MTGQEARDDEREALIREARTWPRDGLNEGALINALADEVERLARKHPDPEWEYGIRPADDDVPLGIEPMPTLEVARARANNIRFKCSIIRRRPAGPWVPVGEGEQ